MTRRRVRIRCRGAVQGVGFRPTVYRLATEAGLAGWIRNDAGGVTIEIEGDGDDVAGFPPRLEGALPPLARVDDLEVEELAPQGSTGFEVVASEPGRRAGALVPPDAAICADCRRDLDDPADRRHRYPFTTCTNCGPRFSLVHSLPYDRATTSMACFPMCPDCAREYRDPGDRRYHAEPVCCPACGPRLWLVDRHGRTLAEGGDAVEVARRALLDGAVVAIKGIGGFQLACRADDPRAVALLRERKRRPRKPFAVMVRSLAEARSLVELDEAASGLLASPRAPVVLARRRRPSPVCDDVAPGLDDLGVMVPATPLHVELLRPDRMPPLVMTSGNLSEEPIARGNREAADRLGDLADVLLLHDRDIVRRVDDSVVRTSDDGPFLVRRARGWVPEPVTLAAPLAEPVLAVGGHLQVTAALAAGRQVFLSQHVGDLDGEPARDFHREVIAGLEEFLQERPAIVAADHHPDYPSRWLAEELAAGRGGRVVGVQHHLAHAAAVLAEHGRWGAGGAEAALCLALDGTGWGPDGTSWGGELLAVEGRGWRRLGHLEPVVLTGGEAAVREPWRVVVAALVAEDEVGLLPRLPLASTVEPGRLETVARLSGGGTWPRASGAGRLFEALGSLLGGAAVNDFEGEAAAWAESLAAGEDPADPWPGFDLARNGRLPVLPGPRLLAEAARRIAGGAPAARVAAEFHATFAELSTLLVVASGSGGPVALGGGCLVNRILRRELASRLEAAGFEVLLPFEIPPGDGGLALGQAVWAGAGVS